MIEPKPEYTVKKPVYRKYKNKPVDAHGYHFDSKAEARRYPQLLLLQRAGTISDLVVHPVYELQPKFRRPDGTAVRAITYEGDFEYIENGRVIVEDVKGKETVEFKIKRKMFWKAYPDFELRLVKA